MSQPSFFNETADPAKFTNQQRGQLAELAFMRKAASLGLSIAKPWNENETYDFIARVHSVCWRVQVKSASKKSALRNHYRVKTAGGRSKEQTPYSATEIDFLVAYIHPENIWYVFPANFIEGRKAICLWPGSKRSTYEQYREAWKLMDPAPPMTPAVTSVAAAAITAVINKDQAPEPENALLGGPHFRCSLRSRLIPAQMDRAVFFVLELLTPSRVLNVTVLI